LIEETAETVEITGIAASSPPIRKRRDPSGAMTTQSDVRSIVPRDTIWKSAKHFWIKRRCRCHKRPTVANIVGSTKMVMSRWDTLT
jgi:hypothetical protein